MCEPDRNRSDVNRDDPWWSNLLGYCVAGFSAGLVMGLIGLLERLF